MVVAGCIAWTYYAVKIACQYCVGSVVSEVVRQSLVEELLSFCPEIGTTVCVTVAQRCIAHPHSDQTTIETFLDVCEFDVLFNCYCCAPSSMIHVAYFVETGYRQLFVLNFLQENDVQLV